MIQPKDITVLVQGPVLGDPWARLDQRFTDRALRRVREVLPGAHLVLSTWRGTNVTGLDFDQLVESEDPGPQPLRIEEGRVTVFNNVNRQIVSTKAGLDVIQTPFALKMRSDLYLDHARFLEDFERPIKPDPELTFVEKRVVSSAAHTRRGPHRAGHRALLFHPNDWFYFGLTTDLRRMLDLPLQTDEDATYFQTHAKDRSARDPLGNVGRFPAEMYLWTEFLKKHRPLPIASYLEVTPELCALSDRTIAANLLLLGRDRLSFTAFKYPRGDWAVGWANFRSHFTPRDWQILYRRYADPGARVDGVDAAPWLFVLRFARGVIRHGAQKMKLDLIRRGRAWLGVDE